MDVFELLKRLIATKSITGEEGEIAGFLGDYLATAGFQVSLHFAGEGRPNVYAWAGTPTVVMSTHSDTVAPYVELGEDDDYIYGRGACDAKGCIAAMIKAGEALLESSVSGFGLMFVVGEEAGSAGAKAANEVPNNSRYLLNGEPTESKMVLGSKGGLKALVSAEGRAAHSAYPELGESAIEKLLDVIQDIRHAPLPANELLGPTTMNVGTIKGGVGANVIAPHAEAELFFRVVNDTTEIKRMLETVSAGRARIDYTFECEPVFMERIEGMETSVVSFTSDIPLLTRWGRPLLFGPGSIHDAHTSGEKISKLELAHAVGTYANMVVRLQERARNEN
ncbi:MAG TPA: M20/M25/M40 family metallo-hydrolase [Blastocatellia bacterium]|nr:M20/M25/M40 family metallo-hydrolase [Blastocatellia bacterium]